MSHSSEGASRLRLDKWLWAARFFKTRALAAEAVEGGKVHLNDQRTKPAHAVHVGDRLRITRGNEMFEIVVQVLDDRRKQASVASQLYVETPESLERRQTEAEQRRLLRAAMPVADQRPDKRQRRHIRRFIGRD